MAVLTQPQLRPLGLGQLLDQSIRLYRRNFLTFVGILALAQVPYSLLQLAGSLLLARGMQPLLTFDPSVSDPNELFGPAYWGGLALMLVSLLVYMVLIYVASAAMTRAAADSYLGRPTSLVSAYRRLGWRWLKVLITFVLALVLMLVISVWGLVPLVGWLTGMGMFTYLSFVIMPLMIPVVVLEKQWALDGLWRTWELARRRFWWTLGFAVLLIVFSILLVAGPATLINVAFQVALFSSGSSLEELSRLQSLRTVVDALVQMIFNLLYLPLHLASMTLLYFDLRVRHEGLDLALLAQNTAPEPAADLPAHTVPAPAGRLVTANEMIGFTGLSLGCTAIMVVPLAGFFLLGGLLLASR